MVDIPQSAFLSVPGRPDIQFLDPQALKPVTPGLVAPPPATPPPNLAQIVDNINNAIAADRAANVPGTTPNGPPDNFAFTDLTTNISGTTPGDVFKSTNIIPDIKNQFIDITPDSLLIRAITPNAFINSGTGNDLLIASSGHNILDGGSGRNVFVGASGPDTFIQDAEKDGGTAFVLNPGPNDDIVFALGKATTFVFSAIETPVGINFTAEARGPGDTTRTSQMTLSGFKVGDLGTKIHFGLSTATDGSEYAFVHVV